MVVVMKEGLARFAFRNSNIGARALTKAVSMPKDTKGKNQRTSTNTNDSPVLLCCQLLQKEEDAERLGEGFEDAGCRHSTYPTKGESGPQVAATRAAAT